MTFLQIVGQASRARANGRPSRWPLFFTLAAALVVTGCGSKSAVPVGDAAEKIRKLALGYVQYAATNRGIGPANQETLAKFMVERNGLTKEEADACFVSPRDNQPFVVRWGQRPMGSGPVGPDPPKPAIIVHESTGADGTVYVANGQVSVTELSTADFAQVNPDAKPTGK